jgi:hypothetical protein
MTKLCKIALVASNLTILPGHLQKLRELKQTKDSFEK